MLDRATGPGRAANRPRPLNLVHRDYASVLRDIHTERAINPDYVAYTVALTDGRVLQGSSAPREAA